MYQSQWYLQCGLGPAGGQCGVRRNLCYTVTHKSESREQGAEMGSASKSRPLYIKGPSPYFCFLLSAVCSVSNRRRPPIRCLQESAGTCCQAPPCWLQEPAP